MFYSLIVLSTIFRAIQAISIPQLSNPEVAPNQLLSLNNATLGSDSPESSFDTSTVIGPEFLSIDATLMNALYFLAEMSSRDHDELVSATTWIAPNFDEVRITTEDDIPAKYLLWGVYQGLEYMIHNKRFDEVLLTLRFDQEIVGKIWFVPSSEPPKSSLASINVTQGVTQLLNHSRISFDATAIQASLANVDSNNTVLMEENAQVGMNTIRKAARLTRFDVFLVCYAALVDMANFPPDSQMRDFVSQSSLNKVFIKISQWHPSVKIRHVIQVMIFLPKTMLRSEEGFREVSFYANINGHKGLEGNIVKGRVPATLS